MMTSTANSMSAVFAFCRRVSVHPQRHRLVLRIAELVGRDNDRTHRTEAVETLSFEPLQVTLLQIARGDVVDRGVPEDVIQGLRARDVLALDADDDAELGLVVHLSGRRLIPGYGVERAIHGRRRLREEHRHRRNLRLAAERRSPIQSRDSCSSVRDT